MASPETVNSAADVMDRIRYARDRAVEAERSERRRLADAETGDSQQAASVRLGTRQAVREALDDVLGESSESELDQAQSE